MVQRIGAWAKEKMVAVGESIGGFVPVQNMPAAGGSKALQRLDEYRE